jgi:hypothetical protein
MSDSYTVEVEGQKIKITDAEFLYFTENENKEKFVVFEYCGKTYQSKIENGKK